jgi:hypothetical protein
MEEGRRINSIIKNKVHCGTCSGEVEEGGGRDGWWRDGWWRDGKDGKWMVRDGKWREECRAKERLGGWRDTVGDVWRLTPSTAVTVKS